MIFIQFLSLNGQEIVLTINNEAVTDEEFIFFMKQERALTYSYFFTNYGAEQSPEFWNTSFAGERPVQYIQNLTIKKLVEINKHLSGVMISPCKKNKYFFMERCSLLTKAL